MSRSQRNKLNIGYWTAKHKWVVGMKRPGRVQLVVSRPMTKAEALRRLKTYEVAVWIQKIQGIFPRRITRAQAMKKKWWRL